jgi:hypothetical protein
MGRAWRRRVFGRFKWLVWAALASSLVFIAMPAPWSYLAGFAAGGLYVGWLSFRDSVPTHIDNWWRGAEGERKTERVLLPLEREGWTVAHDLKARYGNVDHLLIGPAGVFLLDSKWWRGEVSIEGDVATATQIEDPDASWSWPKLPGALRATCAKNHEAIKHLTGVSAWVTGVVVVWSPFAQGVVSHNQVTYVHGDQLCAWLRAQPVRLSPNQITSLQRLTSRT